MGEVSYDHCSAESSCSQVPLPATLDLLWHAICADLSQRRSNKV